ncbi:MAG: undecaprenyl-diphosphate phosphatase [Bacteroidetes bacterium]|nr:MAG: undecaprenyl-diphosphate phosphatase [Bacteroidota bacterium]
MTLFEAIIVAIVEGITEFLPISSTGHMIITQAILGIPPSEFVKAFTVNIQFGAILSVIVLYWKRFFQSWGFYKTIAIACTPLIIAYLLSSLIDKMLGSVLIVAIALVVGGVFLIFVDKWFDRPENEKTKLTYYKALYIGLFQIIAVIPGISRSAATIIGGMSQKISRKRSAEFSFFLAVPTMFAASAFKLYKLNSNEATAQVFSMENLHILLVGNAVAFIVAMITIKFFIAFLTRHGFKAFGFYRIGVGMIILILLFSGHSLTLF